jgi:uncharacterized protein GlcG (DUF336 family)
MMKNSKETITKKDLCVALALTYSPLDYFCKFVSRVVQSSDKKLGAFAADNSKKIPFLAHRNPQLAPFVGGIVLSMEEQINAGVEGVDGESVTNVKAALMGPLSGILSS